MEPLTRESLRATGYRAIIDHFPFGSMMIFDTDLRYVIAGGHGLAELDLTAEEVEGRTIWEALSPATAASIEPAFRRALRGEQASVDVPFRDRIHRVQVSPLEHLGPPFQAGIACVTDVTDERRRAATLALSEQRFRVAFDNAPISMALMALDGRFERVNAALCQMTGYPAELLLQMSLRDLTISEDLQAEAESMAYVKSGAPPRTLTEKRYTRADGGIGWALVALSLVRGQDGAPLHLLAHAQDVTERKKQLVELEQLASSDPLTGVLNRRRFNEELDRFERLAWRYGEEGAVLVIDLDGLKAVNDIFGHHEGDEYIKAAATAICSRVRATDVVARLGGDEFGVLLPHVTVAHAHEVAESLAADIAACPTGGTASVGMAMIDGLGADAALVAADAAMYEAKRAGGNRVVTAPDISTR